MMLGLQTLRAAFALFAAMVLAAASLAAPVSALSEDMHHEALHAASDADHATHAVDSQDDLGPVKHQHPDTPGHSHCSASCHVQISDARFALTVAYVAIDALFVPLTESVRPAAHLDGLFRPPRA